MLLLKEGRVQWKHLLLPRSPRVLQGLFSRLLGESQVVPVLFLEEGRVQWKQLLLQRIPRVLLGLFSRLLGESQVVLFLEVLPQKLGVHLQLVRLAVVHQHHPANVKNNNQ